MNIKCPHCEYEYLPAEIYVAKYFLGTPNEVERDIHGKIINYFGAAPSLEETYVCDKCSKKFNIKADINFTVTKETTLDFSEDYITPIYVKNRFIMEEK